MKLKIGAAVAAIAIACASSASASKIYTTLDFESFGPTPPSGYLNTQISPGFSLITYGLVGPTDPKFSGAGNVSARTAYLFSGYPINQRLDSFDVFRDAGSSDAEAISFKLITYGANIGEYTFTLGAGTSSATFTLDDGLLASTFPPPSQSYQSFSLNLTYFQSGVNLIPVITPGIQFDNIQIVRSAVPEPTTWALAIVGFGMAGAAIRNRRRSVNIAEITA